MNKNKKGFTLIEFIIVVGIVGVIATIVIVSINNSMKKSRNEYNKSLETQIILATKDYYSENKSELPVNGTNQLELKSLLTGNYLSSEVVDANGNSCIGSYITTIKNKAGDYEDYVCLICDGEIISNPEYCDVKGLGDVEKPTCGTVEAYYPDGTAYDGKWTNKNITVKIGVADNVGIGKVLLNGVKVGTLNASGNEVSYVVDYSTILNQEFKFVVYDKSLNESTNTCSIKLSVDKTKPSCIVDKIDLTSNSLGTGKADIVLKMDDKNLNGSNGSGVSGYKLNTDANYTTYNALGTNYLRINALGSYRIMVIDKANNINDKCSAAVLQLCNSNCRGNPTCTISVPSGTGSKTLTINATDTTDTVFTYSWDNATWTSTKTKVVSSSGTYKAYVKDSEGNIGECSASVTITSSGGGGRPSDPDPETETPTTCTKVCYAGASSTVTRADGRVCTYTCSSDGCSGYFHSCSAAEEENPNTGCFLAGTKVLTSDGYKDIDKIKIGDKVLSYNEVTKKTEYKAVLQQLIHKNNTEELYELTIDFDVLKVTAAHRIYIQRDNEYEWITASKLKIGDMVIDEKGITHPITNIIHYPHISTVYNIEVSDNHTYYVSKNNYLVHNCKPGEPGCSSSGSSSSGSSSSGSSSSGSSSSGTSTTGGIVWYSS